MSEFLEQVLPEMSHEAAVSDQVFRHSAFTDAPAMNRAAFEEDRIHAALEALPDESYGSAIEFSFSPTGLTRPLASRCTRLVSSVCATRDLAELRQDVSDPSNALVRPFSATFALPSRKFDLMVFTDVFAMMGDDYADRLCDYALATLAPGGHVLMAHWLIDQRAPLSGDEAAERFLTRVGDELQPMLRRRMPHYRLDVLERVGRA